MKINVNTIFFDEENTRDLYAKDNDYVNFKNTYKKNSTSLINLNTKKFWNTKIRNERGGLSNSPIYNDKIKIVSKFLKFKSGKLLNIGVGYGSLEERLSTNSHLQLFGIDISSESIVNAKRNFGTNFKVENFYNINYRSGTFDFITALDVLEHIPPEKILIIIRKISKCLKDKGFFIVSVPLNEELKKMIEKGVNPNGHLRAYTQDILKTELIISGFRIVDVRLLYAFNNMYYVKSILVKYFNIFNKKPNLCIVFAQKK